MTVAGPPIDFTVRRSVRARRARVTVTRDGAVVVTLPARAAERIAHELVRDRAAWIWRHRSRILQRVAALEARPPLGDGSVIPLEGVRHTLAVRPDAIGRRSCVRIDLVAREIVVMTAPLDPRPPSQVLEAWLRQRARERITAAVARRAPQLGVTHGAIRIGDQASRWGSASRRGTLSFSWRLVLAPPEVLDYVVVHEVAHLVDFSHSARYWRRVRSLTPHVDAARRWLRDHEGELRHALD